MPAARPDARAARVVYLLRHGAPAGGVRYRGSTDDPLAAEGRAQMRRAVTALPGFDGIVTSPLRRCADFARELAAASGTPVAVEPAFRELHFGRWEGRTAAELMEADDESLRRFWADPLSHPPPGGERLDDFQSRVVAGWHAQLRALDGSRLLFIVHGGTVRAILGHRHGLTAPELLRLDVPYASVHPVLVEPGGGIAGARGDCCADC